MIWALSAQLDTLELPLRKNGVSGCNGLLYPLRIKYIAILAALEMFLLSDSCLPASPQRAVAPLAEAGKPSAGVLKLYSHKIVTGVCLPCRGHSRLLYHRLELANLGQGL